MVHHPSGARNEESGSFSIFHFSFLIRHFKDLFRDVSCYFVDRLFGREMNDQQEVENEKCQMENGVRSCDFEMSRRPGLQITVRK